MKLIDKITAKSPQLVMANAGYEATAATVYNGQGTNDSDDFFTKSMLTPPTQTPSQHNLPGSPKINRKVLAIIFIILALAAVSAGLYVYLSGAKNPNSLAGKSVSHMIQTNNSASFVIIADVNKPDKSVRVNKTTIAASIDGEGNVRTEVALGFAKTTLTSSTIIRNKDKELYLKIGNLDSLITGAGYSEQSPILQLINSNKDNWIKFDTTELITAGYLATDPASKITSCYSSYTEYIMGKVKAINQIGKDAYDNKLLINTQKSGTEVINGTNLTIYKLDNSQDKTKQFVGSLTKELLKSDKLIAINCNKVVKTVPSADNIAAQNITNTSIIDPKISITKDNKFIRFTDTVEFNGSSITLTLAQNNKILETAKPSKVLSVTEIHDKYPKYFELIMQAWVRTQVY